MFQAIVETIPADPDLPARAHTLEVRRRVLEGQLYDNMPHEFHEERSGSGEYIPLRKRKPSVRYNVCRLVVEDSTAMLFSGGRFPAIECGDNDIRDNIAAIVKDSSLNEVMLEAALRGSIGSVIILMRVLKARVFFSVLQTVYMTPVWKADAPDTLQSVTEKRKVRGVDLRAQGYEIPDENISSLYWFMRVWDEVAETWYLPWKVTDKEAIPQRDDQRSVQHNLGFVPMVWIKNLPGGDDIDGECTFRAAIDTQIEIEYQLSQGGRGLKYSSDPLLVIREPASPDDSQFVRSADNALITSENGDAKLLEIGGSAVSAVVEYVRNLREIAIETIHGNRSNADKLSAAQSGRALEMMHQPLIWLADKLRVSYGERGLLKLIQMIIEVGASLQIQVGKKKLPRFPRDIELSLQWPQWFTPTESDMKTQSETLLCLKQGGFISRELAVKHLAPNYDNEDVQAEIARIKADEAAEDARLLKEKAQVELREPSPG